MQVKMQVKKASPRRRSSGSRGRLSVIPFCCTAWVPYHTRFFCRSNSSSALMAAWVKLLLYHQLASAAPMVKPALTSCSTWVDSMGSTGLPAALSSWLVSARPSTAVRATVAAEMLLRPVPEKHVDFILGILDFLDIKANQTRF